MRASESSRIVYLSSGTAAFADTSTLERYATDIGGTKLSESTLEAYGVSKTVISLLAFDLQRRLDEAGAGHVLVNAVDPGGVNSGRHIIQHIFIVNSITNCSSSF